MLAADPPPSVYARLDYKAPRGCPPTWMLGAEYGRRRGYDPFTENAPLRVVATITRGKNQFVGSLELYDRADKLIWTRPTSPYWDCKDVVVEMAGALVFRFDPEVSDPLVEPLPPPPPPPPAPPPPPPPLPPPSPPPVAVPPLAPPKPSFRTFAGLDGLLTARVAPGISADAGGALWARIDPIALPLGFELALRSTWGLTSVQAPTAYQPHIAVRSSYVAATLAGCPRWLLAVCPVLEVGSMSYSRVSLVGQAHTRSAAVAAVGLRVVHEHRLAGRFFFRAFVEGERLLKAAPILDDAGQTKVSPSRFSLTLGLGFGRSL